MVERLSRRCSTRECHADQRTGPGIILLGLSVLLSALPSILSSSLPNTARVSGLVSAEMGISALCLIGLGAGRLLGYFNTPSETTSSRSTTLIAIVALFAFAIGALLAVM